MWQGETGFYANDFRAPIEDDQSITWEPIHLWASLEYPDEQMFISFKADTVFPPPTDRDYFLELQYVPLGISGAPPLGTQWQLPAEGTFNLQVPTFRTKNGNYGYRFAFKMSEVTPEPGTACLLILGTALASRRTQKRSIHF